MTGQPALTPYVPRLLLRHLDETPDAAVRRFDGTLVFIDVSGFTQLSERLARQGREGAERLADAIGRCFTTLLTVAYECGGGLLKFGGDALLLLFDGDGHAERAMPGGGRHAQRPARGRPARRRRRPGQAAHVGRRPQRRVHVLRHPRRPPGAAGHRPRRDGRSCGWSGPPRPVRSSSATTRRHACPPRAPGPRPARDGCSAARRPPPAIRRPSEPGTLRAIAWSRRSRLCSERICRTAPAHRSTGWSRSRSSASAASRACWREPVRRPSRTRSTSSSGGPPAQPRGTACACSARTWTPTAASCC